MRPLSASAWRHVRDYPRDTAYGRDSSAGRAKMISKRLTGQGVLTGRRGWLLSSASSRQAGATMHVVPSLYGGGDGAVHSAKWGGSSGPVKMHAFHWPYQRFPSRRSLRRDLEGASSPPEPQ